VVDTVVEQVVIVEMVEMVGPAVVVDTVLAVQVLKMTEVLETLLRQVLFKVLMVDREFNKVLIMVVEAVEVELL
tara:strand:- start:348 stop:569 length:222 start_codon:yes stop_codon:yes gene_type:complete